MKKYYVVSLLVVLSLVLTDVVNAASTIGTNISTTGTFLVNPAADSTTSIRFQNAAGTNYFVADSTNFRIGVGAAPSTTFEVQGTASASYFLTSNTIQVGGGFASVSYNRFGSSATTHSLSATNDVLVNGKFEVDGTAFFDGQVGINGAPSTIFEAKGTASASYFFTQHTIQVGGAAASASYNRFGTAATTHALSANNDVLVGGQLEVDGTTFLDGKASVSGNFQTSGRFIADTAASHSFTGDLQVTSNLILGTAAASSSGGLYTAEFSSPTVGTASFLFAGGGNSASTTGTCFQLKDTAGKWIYMRFNTGATTPTLSTIKCHP